MSVDQFPNFQIANVVVPAGGPKTIPLFFDFTSVAQYTFDCTDVIRQGKIEYVQTLWIDNADNANDLEVDIALTRQRILAPKHSQGFYSVLAPTPPVLTFKTTSAAIIVNVQLLNVPVQPAVWSTQ